jgi:hypothetical protein
MKALSFGLLTLGVGILGGMAASVGSLAICCAGGLYAVLIGGIGLFTKRNPILLGLTMPFRALFGAVKGMFK